MPTFFSIRESTAHATRFVSSTFRQSSAWARVLIALLLVLLAGIGVVLIIPIIIIVGLVLALTAGVVAVRTWIFREKAPNGMLDGRRNVRVRSTRDDGEEPPAA